MSAIGLFVRLTFVSLFWGGTFIAGRVATRTLDPIVIAFFRFLLASIFLVAYSASRQRHQGRPDLRQIGMLAAAGLAGIVAYNLFFFNGLRLIEANRASLIVALNPAAIMFAAGLLGMERLTPVRILGVLLALFGVSLVLTGGDYANLESSFGTGELLILGCVLAWVTYTMLGRALVQEISPLQFTTYSSVVGALGLMIPAVIKMIAGIQLEPAAVLAVIFLGLFGTALAFVWYYEGVQTLGATRAGVFINLVPGWGVLLGALILDEKIATMALVGGAVIVGGVLLTNRRPRRLPDPQGDITPGAS